MELFFDISNIKNRDISVDDIDINEAHEKMFVLFYSDFIEEVGYGTTRYSKEHPQLSDELIDALLSKKISIIGLDFAGLRRGKEHTIKDQHCANHGVFIVENLCNLKSLVNKKNIIVNTYPMKIVKSTGLPCRVIAEYID